MPDIEVLALLLAASFLAGFVDAIAGGGGLVLFPALMLGLPVDTPIPTLLGTNKFAAATGTTAAALRFLSAGTVGRRDFIPPLVAGAGGAVAGAMLAYRLDAEVLRPVMLALLASMLVVTLLKPGLGREHSPRHGLARQRSLATLVALATGFYDGFFGPGTGTLLIFAYVGLLGFDFLRASALAKSANWGSNFGALVLFLGNGSWIPPLALALAVANLAGGGLGANLAIGKGSVWVRRVFVVVVACLLLRLAWQVISGE